MPDNATRADADYARNRANAARLMQAWREEDGETIDLRDRDHETDTYKQEVQ